MAIRIISGAMVAVIEACRSLNYANSLVVMTKVRWSIRT
jgi:hypothetical protein